MFFQEQGKLSRASAKHGRYFLVPFHTTQTLCSFPSFHFQIYSFLLLYYFNSRIYALQLWQGENYVIFLYNNMKAYKCYSLHIEKNVLMCTYLPGTRIVGKSHRLGC